MHAHQRHPLGIDGALLEHQIDAAVDPVAIGFEPPVAAIVRFERLVRHAFDQPVVVVAIGDQVGDGADLEPVAPRRSEEHTSELQSLMRISYAVFCLKKKKNNKYTQY